MPESDNKGPYSPEAQAEYLARHYPNTPQAKPRKAAVPEPDVTNRRSPETEAESLARHYPSMTPKKPSALTEHEIAERELLQRHYPKQDTKPATPPAPTQQEPKVAITPPQVEFELPEGVDASDPVVSELRAAVGELGLDSSKAQRLLDAQVRAAAANEKAWRAEVDGWSKQARADPEIGGDAWDDSLHLAKSVVHEFGTPELRRELNASGLGNHVEMVRVLTRVGKALQAARGSKR